MTESAKTPSKLDEELLYIAEHVGRQFVPKLMESQGGRGVQPIYDAIKALTSLTTERDRLRDELAACRVDKERLDWCEYENNSKDMGHYFEIRTGSGIGNLRARIDRAAQEKAR